MCEVDIRVSDIPVALEESASTGGFIHLFRLKLRSRFRQASKASNAPTKLEDVCGKANNTCGPVLAVRPDIDENSQPRGDSVASNHSKAPGRVSSSGTSSKLENDSDKSRSSNSNSTRKLFRGWIANDSSKSRISQSGVECSERFRLKPPIIKPETYPGPSNLADRCRGSAVQLLSEEDLDISSKYWRFRHNFDLLARRSYRQGEELECLVRCISGRQRIFSFDASLTSAHAQLHKGLSRLHRRMKENDKDLNEKVARIVLAETKILMKKLDSLTADLQLVCNDLQGIFDDAMNSEGSLEQSMSKLKEALPEAWISRRRSTCWTLCREIDRLIYAISGGGRSSAAIGTEAANGDVGKE